MRINKNIKSARIPGAVICLAYFIFEFVSAS